MKGFKIAAAGLLLGFVLLAILFPVFAKPGTGKPGRLVDASYRPIAGKTLSVTIGGRTEQVVTDDSGNFDFPSPSTGQQDAPQISGYVMTRKTRSTGSRTRYLFSENGTLEVTAKDEQGKIQPISVCLQGPERRLATGSIVRFADVPVAFMEDRILLKPENDLYRLVRWDRTVEGSAVKIEAVLRRMEVPLARVAWMTFVGDKVRFFQ